MVRFEALVRNIASTRSYASASPARPPLRVEEQQHRRERRVLCGPPPGERVVRPSEAALVDQTEVRPGGHVAGHVDDVLAPEQAFEHLPVVVAGDGESDLYRRAVEVCRHQSVSRLRRLSADSGDHVQRRSTVVRGRDTRIKNWSRRKCQRLSERSPKRPEMESLRGDGATGPATDADITARSRRIDSVDHDAVVAAIDRPSVVWREP
ncbi:hypothetical protein GJ629_11680, partial [Halapricum sp. CBA1109]|uniref:hypothetical protein n=1 Tax=Halapricum sp. CBA1109 TaxID=2668068 RepID=UPI0012FA6205